MLSTSEPKIRELKRNELRWERQLHRKTDLDINRAGLGEMLREVQDIENLSCAEIKGLASRIKRRKHADAKDLLKLSYGFQQSAENISEFIRITGAINVIVKVFTGSDSDLQQLAAECLCNLSLGDEVCCEKVAMFAGTYLITFIETVNNTRLTCTCVWTLQNMISSGAKAAKVLHSQGSVARFCHLLKTTRNNDQLLAEIFTTIDLILDYGLLFISQETIVVDIIPTASSSTPSLSGIRIIYKSLFLTNFETLDRNTLHDILNNCIGYLKTELGSGYYAERILAIRILGNLIAKNDRSLCEAFLAGCQKNDILLSSLFNSHSEAGEIAICRELLWFYGNLFGTANETDMQKYLKRDNFVENLIVPRAMLN
ncbi:uncharacterized protein LOC129727549 [Wyeomyia smithii]|uniref:uncharacterized protein LOC129727549 n=1 Tax=Wyeomyia smithii TaxID=174621 RepID=UPI00246817AA|nr:uncharacterized protein LOC129727549 [Wyeomyia smithii]